MNCEESYSQAGSLCELEKKLLELFKGEGGELKAKVK